MKTETYKGYKIEFGKQQRRNGVNDVIADISIPNGRYIASNVNKTKKEAFEQAKSYLDRVIKHDPTLDLSRKNNTVRKEIKDYMKNNVDGMAEGHLDGWYQSKYQGNDKEYIKSMLYTSHDNSLLVEELEENFSNVNDKEIDYATDVFNKKVIRSIRFDTGTAVGWVDTTGSINR